MSLDHSANFVKCQNVTHDAFLGGRLCITQPKKGFRAGIDSVLLGASVSADSEKILDIGAGVGTAGLVGYLLSRAAQTLLVEAQPEMVALAKRNIAQNGLEEHCAAICCNIGEGGPVRFAAGIVPDHFSSVIANPPFFEANSGTLAPVVARADARHRGVLSLDDWVRVACSAVAPKGEILFINRIEHLGELLDAFQKRLGDIAVLPLASRVGQAPTRFLIRGIKGSKAPTRLLYPFVVHGETGNDYTPELADVLRGKGRMVW